MNATPLTRIVNLQLDGGSTAVRRCVVGAPGRGALLNQTTSRGIRALHSQSPGPRKPGEYTHATTDVLFCMNRTISIPRPWREMMRMGSEPSVTRPRRASSFGATLCFSNSAHTARRAYKTNIFRVPVQYLRVPAVPGTIQHDCKHGSVNTHSIHVSASPSTSFASSSSCCCCWAHPRIKTECGTRSCQRSTWCGCAVGMASHAHGVVAGGSLKSANPPLPCSPSATKGSLCE